ncbi:imelysin family protein [Tropicibacter sp. R15_0]|uniref:imelysin family protein n=1 Tax=Tropicibacter sp. R15_0 TaxID=2821101 RepID=UPI001AD9F5F4|nr:imelysin family protein [Tropicibacter sp. R15_0]MBO9466428.1 imelysin family protein [Tropicibacter sp. R15_0]
MIIRTLLAALALSTLALPSWAQVVDHAAIRERALSTLEAQFGDFAKVASELSEQAVGYCAGESSAEDFTQAYHNAWLAWAPLDSYQFGPIEQRGAVLRIGFWPDKKGFVGRGLRNLLALPEAALSDPDTIAGASAAAQGLPAIEYLMVSDLPQCPAVIGISAQVSRVADALFADWFAAEGWADLTRQAGPDNPVYLSDAEVSKELFTAMDFGLTRIADMRLGRPMGTFDKPMPRRAEAWRSGLSFDLIQAQLSGIGALLETGFKTEDNKDDIEALLHKLAEIQSRIEAFDAPLDVVVTDPITRFRVEAVQTETRLLQLALTETLGGGMGLKLGFSAADGD